MRKCWNQLKSHSPHGGKKAVCSYLAVVLKIALIDNKEWKIFFNGTECTACRNCWGRFSGSCHSGGQPR